MSVEEVAEIKSQSGRLKLAAADYIRARIFGYKLPSPRGAIDDAAYQLLTRFLIDARNAGANVNQLAHNRNSGFDIQASEVRTALRDLRIALDQVRLHLVKMAADFEEDGMDDEVWTEADA